MFSFLVFINEKNKTYNSFNNVLFVTTVDQVFAREKSLTKMLVSKPAKIIPMLIS